MVHRAAWFAGCLAVAGCGLDESAERIGVARSADETRARPIVPERYLVTGEEALDVSTGLVWSRHARRAYDSLAAPADLVVLCAPGRAPTSDEVRAILTDSGELPPWSDASPWTPVRTSNGCVDLPGGGDACGQLVHVLCVMP